MAPRKPKSAETPAIEAAAVVETSEATAVPESPQESPKAQIVNEVLHTADYTLVLGFIRVVPVGPEAGRVTVENTTVGELYVATSFLGMAEAVKTPILPGEIREFKGAASLHLMSHSRPTARITHFAK